MPQHAQDFQIAVQASSIPPDSSEHFKEPFGNSFPHLTHLLHSVFVHMQRCEYCYHDVVQWKQWAFRDQIGPIRGMTFLVLMHYQTFLCVLATSSGKLRSTYPGLASSCRHFAFGFHGPDHFRCRLRFCPMRNIPNAALAKAVCMYRSAQTAGKTMDLLDEVFRTADRLDRLQKQAKPQDLQKHIPLKLLPPQARSAVVEEFFAGTRYRFSDAAQRQHIETLLASSAWVRKIGLQTLATRAQLHLNLDDAICFSSEAAPLTYKNFIVGRTKTPPSVCHLQWLNLFSKFTLWRLASQLRVEYRWRTAALNLEAVLSALADRSPEAEKVELSVRVFVGNIAGLIPNLMQCAKQGFMTAELTLTEQLVTSHRDYHGLLPYDEYNVYKHWMPLPEGYTRPRELWLSTLDDPSTAEMAHGFAVLARLGEYFKPTRKRLYLKRDPVDREGEEWFVSDRAAQWWPGQDESYSRLERPRPDVMRFFMRADWIAQWRDPCADGLWLCAG